MVKVIQAPGEESERCRVQEEQDGDGRQLSRAAEMSGPAHVVRMSGFGLAGGRRTGCHRGHSTSYFPMAIIANKIFRSGEIFFQSLFAAQGWAGG
jgi:hypothetical protein